MKKQVIKDVTGIINMSMDFEDARLHVKRYFDAISDLIDLKEGVEAHEEALSEMKSMGASKDDKEEGGFGGYNGGHFGGGGASGGGW